MDKLAGMETFVRVIEGGSFAAAAEATGVSATMVAKQVRAIEDRLGARLLHRTTRGCCIARRVATSSPRSASCTSNAVAPRWPAWRSRSPRRIELQQAPRGQLRIVAPKGFGSRTLAPALAEWAAAHPDVGVDLALDDRPEDHVARGHELAVVIGELRDDTLVARPLRPYRRVRAAAPAYLAARGVPRIRATWPRIPASGCATGATMAAGTWITPTARPAS